jgi:hypothetical protein
VPSWVSAVISEPVRSTDGPAVFFNMLPVTTGTFDRETGQYLSNVVVYSSAFTVTPSAPVPHAGTDPSPLVPHHGTSQ